MTTYMQQGQLPDRSQTVKDIVDRLKKQGLFDQFRKECLADVDTKPAYQNLRHRVEGAVARFLSTQTWHPDLNKKQLRDSLRRHITESQMLTTGVDRVVEQVVNPKIYKVFKAPLDRAVCEFLGMDYEAWIEKLKQRDELKRQIHQLEQQKKHQQQMSQNAPDKNAMIGGIPSLMELPVQTDVKPGMVPPNPMVPASDVSLMAMGNTSIPGMSLPPGMSNAQLMQPVGALPMGMTPGMTPGLPYNPGIPGFPATFPQQQQLPGTYPGFYPHGYPAVGFPSTSAASAPPAAAAPPVPSYWPTSTEQTIVSGVLNLPHNPTLHQILNPPVPGEDSTEKTNDSEKKKEKTKKEEIEPLTVESFLNIPLPKSEPPKVKDKKKDEQQEKIEPEKTEVVVMDTAEQKDIEVECIEVDSIMLPSGQYESGETEEGGQQKIYHFAWDNMEDDSFSDITVSSIHTSDLSSFDDDASHDTDHDVYFIDEEVKDEEVDKVEENAAVEEILAAQSGGAYDSSDASTPGSSPVKAPPPVAAPPPIAAPPPAAVTPPSVKPRPKKLISLSYNFSDSDDDETREERKARIAREKEERYLRRQQRRAELEQKRKEREQEKARLKAEKQRQKAALREQLKDNDDEVKVKTDDVEAEQLGDDDDDDGKEELLKEGEDSKNAEDKKELNSSVLVKDGVEQEKEDENVKEKEANDKQLLLLSPDNASTPSQKAESPRKRPKISKEEAKEILREQKVMEKRMALRRRRTRNRRYVSDEFTSIFTERKNLLTGVNDTYVEEIVVEHAVEIEAEPITDANVLEVSLTRSEDSSTQNDQIVYAVPHAHEEVITSTSDHIVEQHAPPKFDSGHMTRSRSRQAPAPRSETPIPKERPSSPYSDISTSSRDSEDVKDEQSKEELNSSVTDSMRGRTRRSRRHSSMTSADPEDSRPSSPPHSFRPHVTSKHYDIEDLYKPRLSWRRRSESDKSRGHSDSYQSRLPFCGSLRGQSPVSEDDKSVMRTKGVHDIDAESVYEPISTPEQDFDDKSDDERSSHHTQPSRSRSRSKSRSRSPYCSRSRSRSCSASSSSSGSRIRHHSRSSTGSSARCHSVSQSHHNDEDEISGGDDKKDHARVPIDKINFGEAAKRAKRKFIDDVDFGEAERHVRGQVQPARGFPAASPSFRGLAGRGRTASTRGETPARGAPVTRGKFPGPYPARGMRRAIPPARGAISPRATTTSPHSGSPSFRPHTANFAAFQRQTYTSDGATDLLSSPDKRRPWLRSRSSESDSTPAPSFSRSSKEDPRSKAVPSGEEEARYWDEDDPDLWGRGSSSGRDGSRCHSPSSRYLKSSRSQSPHSSQRSLSSGERTSSPEEGETSDGGEGMESADSAPPGKRVRHHSPGMSSPVSHHSLIGHGSPPTPHRRFHDLPDHISPPGSQHESRRPKHVSPKGHGVHEDRPLRGPPVHGYDLPHGHITHGRLREGGLSAGPSVRGSTVRRPVHMKQSSDEDDDVDDVDDDGHNVSDDMTSPYQDYGPRRLTRAGRKRSEEENAPIAKRLRHH